MQVLATRTHIVQRLGAKVFRPCHDSRCDGEGSALPFFISETAKVPNLVSYSTERFDVHSLRTRRFGFNSDIVASQVRASMHAFQSKRLRECLLSIERADCVTSES